MGKAEVRAKLKLDDEASAELAKIKRGFGEVSGAQKKTSDGFAEMAKQAAATALAVNFRPAAESVLDFGKSFYTAAAAGDAADTAVAGLVAQVQGLPFDKAKKQAQGYGDDLDAIGVKAGVMGDDLAQAYQVMLEISGATKQGTGEALRHVQEISTIAGTLGKSSEGLSREYSLATEGTIRMKGQLFQLLQTTGIFGKHTKDVGTYWASLTEESRIKALDYGMGRVASSMAKAEPSAKQLMVSVENLYDMTKERLGEPLMNELVPILKQVKDEWAGAIPDIEKFAKVMAHDLGDAVKEIERNAMDAFRYLNDHQQEIRAAIREGYDKAKAVVEFILRHKEAIAIAFGAKAVLPGVQAGAGAVKSLYGAGSALGAQGFVGQAGGAAAGGVAALALVASVGAALYALKTLDDGLAEQEDDNQRLIKSFRDMADKGDVQGIERVRDTMKMVADVAGKQLDPAMRAMIESAKELAEVTKAATAANEEAIKKEIQLGVSTAIAGQTNATGDQAANLASNAVFLLIDAYNTASKQGNAALAQVAAQTIAGSAELQKALLKSGVEVEGGLSDFAEKLVAGASQFASFGDALKAKAAAKTAPAPVLQMTGGQTFKITQDFRDGDPDRIFMSFQDDVIKAATRRFQAGTSQPFGG